VLTFVFLPKIRRGLSLTVRGGSYCGLKRVSLEFVLVSGTTDGLEGVAVKLDLSDRYKNRLVIVERKKDIFLLARDIECHCSSSVWSGHSIYGSCQR